MAERSTPKAPTQATKGKTLTAVEIHIFEESDTSGGTITPVGKYKIIPNVPFISQVFKYPTGCESVSTVMALQYAGVNITSAVCLTFKGGRKPFVCI